MHVFNLDDRSVNYCIEDEGGRKNRDKTTPKLWVARHFSKRARLQSLRPSVDASSLSLRPSKACIDSSFFDFATVWLNDHDIRRPNGAQPVADKNKFLIRDFGRSESRAPTGMISAMKSKAAQTLAVRSRS